MVTIEKDYLYQDQTYHATITFKKMRNLRLRYDQEMRTFRVSVPLRTSMREIDRFVFKYLPSMVKKPSRKKPLYADGYLYVFGKQIYVGEATEKEILDYYKRIGLPKVKERVDYFCKKMGVDQPYKVRLRDMRKTFGSNSRRTMTLTFQTRMMAFSMDVIDSVVVHELAHHFHFDHSPKFYHVVYKYCPNYDALRRRLTHDEFAAKD